MKIKINYDMMKKINTAKNGDKLSYSLNEYACIPFASIPTNIILSAVFNTLSIYGISIAVVFCGAAYAFVVRNDYKRIGEIRKSVSELELIKLSLEMTAQNVQTSYDLLMNTRLTDKEYEKRIDEDGKLQLIQKKYLEIETYNDGNIETTSICQEHQIKFPPSDEYVLTLGSKTKVKKLKPAFNGA